ncbi:MAG TPA: ATP-binding protein [Candidatus Udaeobacter sp.]|nr:ATP-binding protein [Candidatus Udaeobacter sp.]
MPRGAEALESALDARSDAALAQALASRACDASGPGFERAHVLGWNEREAELVSWATAGASTRDAASSRETSSPSRPLARVTLPAPEALEGAAGEAWRTGLPMFGDAGSGVPWSGAAVIAAIPLVSAGRRVGLLVGEWNDTSAGDPSRVERFAAEVAAILGAATRAALERRRLRHGRALEELTRASVSAQNVAEALHLAARLAAESSGSRGAAVWRVIEGAPRLEVTFGLAGEREQVARALTPAASSALASGKPQTLDERAAARICADAGLALSSVAVFPLSAYGRERGAIAVYDRAPRGSLEPPDYDEVERSALTTLADVLALVLDHAERFDEVRRLELRGRELQARVSREERLAARSEAAARISGEARNPIASIGAFARRVHRELEEGSPHREYLEIVIREAERLEKILAAPVDPLAAEPLRLRVESLNEPVQDALRAAGETLVRRRVRLLKRLAPDLPTLLIDGERVRLAIGNILNQALESVSVGGRIRVESRRNGGFAVLEIAHDGPREAGDLIERLFVPFSSDRGLNASLGLTTAQQIVQAHGGEVRVRSEAEWTAIVSLTLPIRGNEDRRMPQGERRQPRPDRRRRGPER